MFELKAAEFFAGIGLMRSGLEQAGISTTWANDIEPDKRDMYVANFGDREFILGDVRDIDGSQVPTVDLATASFPCTDLSLAGTRRGIGSAAAPRGASGGSSMFWEFARVLEEMGDRRPRSVLLENVLGFATSHGGRDLRDAVARLNRLGYSCDLVALDARHFVPQSRPRMFIVGLTHVPNDEALDAICDRPVWIQKFVAENPDARLHSMRLPALPDGPLTLEGVIDPPTAAGVEWWEADRVAGFLSSLSDLQAARLDSLKAATSKTWRTAYRRTRNGSAVWEIRADEIAGCLRTARGGSSKQALVEVGKGDVRIRWMTPREYARLMGAPEFKLAARRNQALFGFGDAVCVPVVAWLCENYLHALNESHAAAPIAA